VQVGADIARLNWGGWNVHIGTTAGYLGSNASDNNGLRTSIEVPFFGTYIVGTYGRFFADLMVRQDFYNLNVDNPNFGLFTQPISAHGLSVSTSAGYNYALANNWFIEPSAGFIYSKTKVDDFNSAVPNGLGATIGGTTSTSDVTSEIGRLSLRVGTTYATPKVVYQPFASASVFHEFAGDVASTFAFCPTCAVVGGFPLQYAQQSTTTRVGTYGQFSVGVAAQIVNTGWLGFVRADYRKGDNIDGYTGNVGLRYQFSPDAIAAAFPTKAPVKAVGPVFGTSNWTGAYVGGFFGGAYGRNDIKFAASPITGAANPYVFGPLGGAQIGYNYQFSNNWVVGVEGDVGAANLRGGRNCGIDDGTGNATGFNPFYQDCNDRVNWIATATARVGYAWGRTLYYVKAGGAASDGRIKVDCVDGTFVACLNPAGVQYPTFNANGTETTQTNRNRYGWTIGYGTEFDLGKNWSAKAEYDYIAFGRQTLLASDGATLISNRSTISEVKIGLNYRFSGPGAIVAKY
jgi:opacity protein-like surface antigen